MDRPTSSCLSGFHPRRAIRPPVGHTSETVPRTVGACRRGLIKTLQGQGSCLVHPASAADLGTCAEKAVGGVWDKIRGITPPKQ